MSFGPFRILVCLLALAMAGVANAQALPKDSIDPTKVLAHFSSETIDATMTTVTGNHLARVDEAGHVYVSAFAASGLQFSVHFHQCTETDGQTQCAALQLLTSWEVEEGTTGVDQLLANAVPNNLFVNMGLAPDGRPYMTRIVIAGQGISHANLASDIEIFLQTAERFSADLNSLDAS